MARVSAAAVAKWAAWGLVTFLAVGVSLVSLRVLTFNPMVIDSHLRQNLIDHPVPFYAHVILGPLAMLIGAWQFLPITRRSRYHRFAGRAYVVLCLVSAIAGFMIAVTTTTGPVTGTAFAILAVLWFGVTLRGYLHGRAREIVRHRRWMIRSYALTCAAITLRIILPVGMASGLGFYTSYVLAAWGCWTINLVIAEAIIRWPARARGRPLAAA